MQMQLGICANLAALGRKKSRDTHAPGGRVVMGTLHSRKETGRGAIRSWRGELRSCEKTSLEEGTGVSSPGAERGPPGLWKKRWEGAKQRKWSSWGTPSAVK